MARDSRLVDPRLCDDVGNLLLAVPQRLHDTASSGIGQGLECVHMHNAAYAACRISSSRGRELSAKSPRTAGANGCSRALGQLFRRAAEHWKFAAVAASCGVPPVDATKSVALLGPTNTGKTHRAVERMLEHESGMIGLPLRLLAREVYDRTTKRLGEDRVALITGEEKRVPPRPDYWICTTEAMPLTRQVDFVAIDEVQLATHPERGHVFTDRLLHARGRRETWFLGAATMREVLSRLVPAAHEDPHPRLSKLSFAGGSKLSRLRPRSAVVAFSLKELYMLAGRLCSLRGGTAVVLGALSPRARNAQVALFQSGEVDYLVATDAVGLGLNLELSHVAFASLRKFDGQKPRNLADAELAQIAGRAGRWLRDGTFGTVLPLELDRDVAARIEAHRFDSVRSVRFRNAELDFSSPAKLLASLRELPKSAVLNPVSSATDLRALEVLLRDPEIGRELGHPSRVQLLWRVCQIPDFRKLLFEGHVELLRRIFQALVRGPLDSDFMAAEYRGVSALDGDADTLMARIARLRTWAFAANQASFVSDAAHWQGEFAALEDRLSDALHGALVQRFVERSTRAKPGAVARVQRKAPEPACRDDSFRPFAVLENWQGRLATQTGGSRADGPKELLELVDAAHESFSLDAKGRVLSGGRAIAELTRGASLTLPEVRLLDQSVGAGLRLRLQRRMLAFARDAVTRLLEPLRQLGRSPRGSVRAVAYQLEQGLGTALSFELAPSLAELSVDAELELRTGGVAIGRLSVSLPALTRRGALEQRAALLCAHQPGLALPAELGRPSYPVSGLQTSAWLALGYVPLGPWALRADLAERAATNVSDPDGTARGLSSFGVPRTDRPRVAQALLRRVTAPAAPAPRS
jgi:ATP-dependent RNA helicase SUPV3L1/SUV3